MNKINCKVISINIDSESDIKSVQGFGTLEDIDGNKLRYVKRRHIINNFLSDFNESSIKIEYFNAITPKDFNCDVSNNTLSESIIFDNKKFEIKKSIWSCHLANFLSHYEIWNIEEDTLVLEDDIIFDSELFKKIPSIIESFLKLEENNKILYLQISTPWLEDAREKSFHLSKINENIGKYIAGDVSGTAAYYITKECKKVLLENIKPILPCDQYLDNLLKSGIINYYLPIDQSMMFKLDTKTMLL